jgi:hypothetical protein
MPSYGLLTNPSIEIISEISKIHDLSFEYAEISIEGPEGNPEIINKNSEGNDMRVNPMLSGTVIILLLVISIPLITIGSTDRKHEEIFPLLLKIFP